VARKRVVAALRQNGITALTAGDVVRAVLYPALYKAASRTQPSSGARLLPRLKHGGAWMVGWYFRNRRAAAPRRQGCAAAMVGGRQALPIVKRCGGRHPLLHTSCLGGRCGG